MDDRTILVEDSGKGYGTLGDGEGEGQTAEMSDKATWFGALFDKCMPAVVWTQITLGLPKVTDNPTEETGKRAITDISRFGKLYLKIFLRKSLNLPSNTWYDPYSVIVTLR